jgi:hypothetical protein
MPYNFPIIRSQESVVVHPQNRTEVHQPGTPVQQQFVKVVQQEQPKPIPGPPGYSDHIVTFSTSTPGEFKSHVPATATIAYVTLVGPNSPEGGAAGCILKYPVSVLGGTVLTGVVGQDCPTSIVFESFKMLAHGGDGIDGGACEIATITSSETGGTRSLFTPGGSSSGNRNGGINFFCFGGGAAALVSEEEQGILGGSSGSVRAVDWRGACAKHGGSHVTISYWCK